MKMMTTGLACAGLLSALPAAAAIEKSAWGESPDHQKVAIYTLTNAHGMSARVTDFGAYVVSLSVPDKTGKLADVVLGFDTLEGYKTGTSYGSVMGRYANRIGNAQFTLEGKTYHLAANDGPNNVHGGPIGFNRHLFTATTKDGPSPRIVLHMVSPDGDQGFPGAVSLTVTYTVTAANALRVDFRATTDQPTVVNLTNHSYFNLKGAGNGDVLDTRLQIFADEITATDSHHLATGEVKKVAGTGFDFTEPKAIGSMINGPDPSVIATPGYDINYIVRGPIGTLRRAAHITEPESGRVMDVFTTQPGVQLYVPNNAQPVLGKGGAKYIYRGAFCLETQHFANSPNVPAFPTTELKPGHVLHEVTEFRFSTTK